VGFSVDQRQSRAPGAAKNHPTFNAKSPPDCLNIVDKIPRRVAFYAGMRPRSATTALIEQNDVIGGRVEIASHCWATAAARTTVQDYNWLGTFGSAFLDIQLMAAANLKTETVEWLYRWVKRTALRRHSRSSFIALARFHPMF
jgi:hypothetical protein